jgi:hypothetical protein
MNIEDSSRLICGVHVTEVGDIAVVWLAHDKKTDRLLLYDCAKFRQQPWAVIGEGFTARGKHIPIAWASTAKATMKELEDRGLNVIPEPVQADAAFDEIMSQTITNRMKTQRFKIGKLCVEFRDEAKTFVRDDAKVPKDSHPLMAATRHAVARLEWARPVRRKTAGNREGSLAPKLAIV